MSFRLPQVPSADELIDKAFRAGSKAAKSKRSTPGPRPKRLRDSERRRVIITSRVIESNLLSIIKRFPSYEQLPAFQQRLLEVKINKDRYKKSLGAVQWCLKNVQDLKNETYREITRGNTKPALEFLGRAASMIKRIRKELDELIEIKHVLEEFPVVEDLPTIVIAGYPNVGKSTFMKTLTGSNVKIASYPFTTQSILVGHKKTKYVNYQIIDSPGLLDRSMNDRNQIEMQAVIAIKELADAVLFLIDPNFDLEEQLSLLKEVEHIFDARIFVAINKADATPREKMREAASMMAGRSVDLISSRDEADCVAVFERIAKEMKDA